MTELATLIVAGVTGGAGLWLHDWRCIVGGCVLVFAAWLMHDVDACIARSSRDQNGLS